MLRIKYERIRIGLSCTATALLVGLHQPTYTLIENGRLLPTPTQLARLAALFKIPISELLQPVVLLNDESLALVRVGKLHLEVMELEREVASVELG